MPITRSELVKQLSKTYPNLLKKDLEKFFDIFVNEIKLALKNNTTLKEEALKLKYLSEDEFDKWVDPKKMTGK